MDEMGVFPRLAHHSISAMKRIGNVLSSVSLSPLLLRYLISHSTFPSIISHFPLQPLFPLFGPIIFLSTLLLLHSVSPSSSIQCGIISHFHSVSLLAYIFASPVRSRPCTHALLPPRNAFSLRPPRLFPPYPHATALG